VKVDDGWKDTTVVVQLKLITVASVISNDRTTSSPIFYIAIVLIDRRNVLLIGFVVIYL